VRDPLDGQIEHRSACVQLKPNAGSIARARSRRTGWLVKLLMEKARDLALSEIGRTVGRSSRSPRNSHSREMAIAFTEKSRRRRSSIMVGSRISGCFRVRVDVFPRAG